MHKTTLIPETHWEEKDDVAASNWLNIKIELKSKEEEREKRKNTIFHIFASKICEPLNLKWDRLKKGTTKVEKKKELAQSHIKTTKGSFKMTSRS